MHGLTVKSGKVINLFSKEIWVTGLPICQRGMGERCPKRAVGILVRVISLASAILVIFKKLVGNILLPIQES